MISIVQEVMFKSPQPPFSKGGWGDFVDEINVEV
jgi:hypothetical protein